MIPLKVDVRSQTVPLVTVTLIAVNLAVFCYQVSLQLGLDSNALRAADDFVREFGVMPCRLTGRCRLPEEAPPPVLTIFTSMFVHGGVMHLGGNMLYLWVFGHNVEDALGHGRFAIFYLLTGVAAVFGQTLVGPASAIPMVGASGAVSGVLGAYVLLFPRATILTLVTFGFFWRFVHLPAVVVLGLWIGLQVVSGYLTFGLGGGGEGGIAFFAHIGGFLAGMAALFVLRPRGTRRL